MPVPEQRQTQSWRYNDTQRKEGLTMQGICTEMDVSFSIAFTMTLACKVKRLVAETEFDQPSC